MNHLVKNLEALEVKVDTLKVVLVNDKLSLAACRSALTPADVLAWDCEGVCIGRTGTIELIQLATPAACFLLDVGRSCKERDAIIAFAKTLLEDARVLKIIHDPSMDADALTHLHGITVANVHDTQAYHMVLRSNAKRPNLNESLVAFGCPTNGARDKSVYKMNPAYWRTRPMTKQMIAWASDDVTHLFTLCTNQLTAAKHSASLQSKAKAASEARLNSTRNSLLTQLAIHPTQVGNLIGKRGVNIDRLRASTGAEIQNSQSGNFVVYSPDLATQAKALRALQQYTIAWRSNYDNFDDDYDNFDDGSDDGFY